MRKILMATTALVGFVAAGAAQAATAPLNVTVGGDVDVLAGMYHEAAKSVSPTTDLTGHDFETLYDLNFAVNGKTGNGIEYGGNLSLNNTPDISNFFRGNSNGVSVTTADVFMSGAFGKVQLGDSHGATDLVVLTPSVGEGQTGGRYMDFLGTTTFAKVFALGVDNTDHSTNITYFTPKVGNDTNKVQLGVSYVPSLYNYGASTDLVSNNTTTGNNGGNALSPYRDVVKGALAYTGTFHPVTIGASANVITGTADAAGANGGWLANAPGGKVRDFTSWGAGVNAAAEGFTVGVNYTDEGHYNTEGAQNKDQHIIGAGVKYEFSKVGVAFNYLGGESYDNMLALATGTGTGSSANYVKDFNSYGLGGTYTWAPGLTTNVDGVLFDQKMDTGTNNDGYVLLVSQKLAF